MPILKYTTEISVAKTMGEIQAALARRGVRSISTHYDEDGTPAGIAFTMQTEYGLRDFQLPVRTSGVLAAMSRDNSVPRGRRTPQQAARVAWRISLAWLEAQSALIDAGLATLDEVMLPWMLDGSGTSAFEVYRAAALRELEE